MKCIVNFENPRGYVEQVELDNGEVWRVEGYCNRCGECCHSTVPPLYRNEEGGCRFLVYENVDGHRVSRCETYFDRPMGCALYPKDPYAKLPDKCSYNWVRVK